jgi:molybdopterin molybdotransferase
MREGLTVSEARTWVMDAAQPLESEMVATREAVGRVLAAAVDSSRQIPPADCSAMDGYALRRHDTRGGSPESPAELSVVYEVAAGAQAPRPLEAGEAARIFTGAPIPPGADAVVKQEDVASHVGVGERVRIQVEAEPHANVRDAGEDLQIGDRVLEAGMEIRSAHVGVLASLGRAVIPVHRRPRVAILSGGNELVEIDGDVSGGRIVASNAYALAAECHSIGAVPTSLGIAQDRPDAIERQFRAALSADCIVSSAGVSVGDHDHVRPVLEKLGCKLEFWGVKMKPGFPLAFGRFDPALGTAGRPGPLVFGLPGNPVSASVTFEQFVRPVLLRMLGHARCFRPVIRARLAEPLRKQPGRLHFVRVTLEEGDDGVVVARSTGSQSSGVMRSLVQAQGLLVFPLEASELAAGDEVAVQVLDEGFFAHETPAF